MFSWVFLNCSTYTNPSTLIYSLNVTKPTKFPVLHFYYPHFIFLSLSNLIRCKSVLLSCAPSYHHHIIFMHATYSYLTLFGRPFYVPSDCTCTYLIDMSLIDSDHTLLIGNDAFSLNLLHSPTYSCNQASERCF